MKIIVAHAGKQHSLKTAEAFYLNQTLNAYITTVYDKPGTKTRLVNQLLTGKLRKRGESRKSSNLPDNKIVQFLELPSLFLLILDRLPFLQKLRQYVRNNIHDKFGKKVAIYAIENNVDCVIMYDTNATVCFNYLKRKAPQIKRILDVSIANRIYLKDVYLKDQALYPDSSDILKEQKTEVTDKMLFRIKKEIESTEYFLAGSTFVKNSLTYSGVDPKRIFVLPYGVDLKTFTHSNLNAKKQTNRPLKLLYVGQICFRKGLHHLLHIVSQFAEDKIELTIAGHLNKSSVLFKEYAQYKNIKFLGFITRDEIAKVFKESDVFVLPSLAEGFALVTLEAMGSGLPIICSTNTGCNDVITDYFNGFVIMPSDRNMLQNRIEWFLNNKDKIFEMGQNAYNTALKYSWDEYFSKLIKALKYINAS